MVREEEYLLTNQEILGGLKAALSRGETLKNAMMTFYRAGYKKEEIEDAAKAYLYLQKGISEVGILKKDEEAKKAKLKGKPLVGGKVVDQSKEESKSLIQKVKSLVKGKKPLEEKGKPLVQEPTPSTQETKPLVPEKEQPKEEKIEEKPKEEGESLGEKEVEEKPKPSAQEAEPPVQKIKSLEKEAPKKETITSPGIKQNIFGQPKKMSPPKTNQKVSKYPPKLNPFGRFKGKIITIVLILTLVALLGILAAVVLFKDELVEFFNKMFG